MLDQRLRERTVPPGTIGGDVVELRGIGAKDARGIGARLYFHRAGPAQDLHRAVGPQRDDSQAQIRLGRVRPAGIEEHNPDLCRIERRQHGRHADEVPVYRFRTRVTLLV